MFLTLKYKISLFQIHGLFCTLYKQKLDSEYKLKFSWQLAEDDLLSIIYEHQKKLSRLKTKYLHLFKNTDIHISQIKVTEIGFFAPIC